MFSALNHCKYEKHLSASGLILLLVLMSMISCRGGRSGDRIPVEVRFYEDFEKWDVCDAISEKMVDSHWSKAQIQSESKADPDADDLGIQVFKGSKVIRSDFLAGQCCYEREDCEFSNGGVGGHIEKLLKRPSSEYYAGCYIYLPEGFRVPVTARAAIGLRSGDYTKIGDSGILVRLILMDRASDEGGYAIEPVLYIYDYAGDPEKQEMRFSLPGTGLSTGRWHHLAMRVYSGDPDRDNGLVEFFLDFKKRGPTFPLSAKSTAAGMTLDLQTFSFQTYTGGCAEKHQTLQDQEHYVDQLIVFKYGTGADVPRGGEPSKDGRMLVMPDSYPIKEAVN